MKSILIFLISFLSLGTIDDKNVHQVQETTTYYFIRHAEKDETNRQDRDPKLTEEGLKRTAKWAEVFKDVEFDLIFSSDTKRTRTTASAIADSREKEVNIYDPKKLYDPEFQKQTKGKTVLVVGHSNTNPAFVNLILETEKYEAFSEKEYGSLFIVSVSDGGKKTSQLLYIN